MPTNRIEAFSDGVIAVIITIMVLELKVPHDSTFAALLAVAPLLHAARHADARLLWSNNNLLFWMSLVPFVTAYMGNNHRDPHAVAPYGVVMLMCGSAFAILRSAISAHHRDNPEMMEYQHRTQTKNVFSAVLYAASVPLAFVDVRISFFIYAFVALSYFLPERKLAESEDRS